MKITNVACIGAGLIGTEWATLFSSKGLTVAVQDANRRCLDKVKRDVESNLLFLSENGLIGGRDVGDALDRMTVHDRIAEAVAKAEYVQESIFENYDAKKKVFAEIEKESSKDAIIASSTSALLMSEIQKAVKRPERCVIVHPVNPAHIVPFVDIVPGLNTSKETVNLTYEFMSNLGKTAVICKKEVPGFVVNRLQAALYREAFDLVDKGVATVEDVDKAITAGLGLRWAFMGPFLVMHLGGGEKGIEYWLTQLSNSYKTRWESMTTWSSIPESARKKTVEGIRSYELLRGRQYSDLVKWRDEKLVKLLRTIRENP